MDISTLIGKVLYITISTVVSPTNEVIYTKSPTSDNKDPTKRCFFQLSRAEPNPKLVVEK